MLELSEEGFMGQNSLHVMALRAGLFEVGRCLAEQQVG